LLSLISSDMWQLKKELVKLLLHWLRLS
jgi:hypothetical protein